MSLASDLVFEAKHQVKEPDKPKDRRVTNQYGVVFKFDDGSNTTADALAEYYQITPYRVKKIYHENNKDYLISNTAIICWVLAKDTGLNDLKR